MDIEFGREICGDRNSATSREWLVTNGIGGYASGTVGGALTRRYHGLLVAALNPPLGRTLLLTKLDEEVEYDDRSYPLYFNEWATGDANPLGFQNIESFKLDGTVPTWKFAIGDALLVKSVWMQQGTNTTYVRYQLKRATQPLKISLKALVNYRDYHGDTQAKDWVMDIATVNHGIRITADADATPFYLLCDRATVSPTHEWFYGFSLAVERYRGMSDREDHLHAATFEATLNPGDSLTIVASTEFQPELDGIAALKARHVYEQKLIGFWDVNRPNTSKKSPAWINQLVLAADQFIVNRSTPPQSAPNESAPNESAGKTIIAGYHWFSDWGRDTMISLPGLTLATGRPEVARAILRTFAQYVSQGMLPNRFPDGGETPEYNTVDATLWYFEAIRQYYNATDDEGLLRDLFPVLADIIDWHCRGTRYNIHLDPSDGLLYAGEVGVQLTWMDAKADDWVVTPRMGKPVEINALWYNALRTMAKFARQVGEPHQEYEAIADRTLAKFHRFWNAETGYCYDVIDTPNGDEDALRPNQIFAVSLSESPLPVAQQRAVVDVCGQRLVTSYGVRSLSPDHRDYQGYYKGDRYQRDGAYHQGTVWGWLLGSFVTAHLRVYNNPALAQEWLEPMAQHLRARGLGSGSEIFDGDAPMVPRGCIAQAWTVAEVLRAWVAVETMKG
ncbi:MAG: amylo-alpha-1,6-glucosidase [Timaviella obliquedivisa GSE-PSE-MK23-08B]|jgi:predicted glycogen debranching enzyme|nr:amylo-alpha-1,6-glucosidase [Timaviella obliquedivisa GSE-PSE-MK23-08B]